MSWTSPAAILPKVDLALLLDRLGLQRDEVRGHEVERLAQLRELVAALDRHALAEVPFRQRPRAAHQRGDRPQERPAPGRGNCHGRKQRQPDGQRQEALEANRQRKRLRSRLLEDHAPAEPRNRLDDAQHGAAVGPAVSRRARDRALVADRPNQLVRVQVLAARDPRLLVRVAVGDQSATPIDQQRKAGLANPDPIDEAPQLLEPQAADQIGGRAVGLIDPQRHHRRRQQVAVDLDVGDGRAGTGGRRGVGQGQRRRRHPARYARGARSRSNSVTSLNSGNAST